MGSGVSNSVEGHEGAADALQRQSSNHFSWLGSKRSSASQKEPPDIVAFMQALPADSQVTVHLQLFPSFLSKFRLKFLLG